MKYILIVFLCIFTGINTFSQNGNRADSLRTLIKKEKTDTGRIVHSYRLAYELQYSNPEESEIIAIQTLAEAKMARFPKGIGNSLIQLGNIEQIKGNNIKAEEYNLEALEVLEKADEKEGIAVCYNNLGIIAHNSNNYSKAVEYYRKSLDINHKIGRKSGEATAIYCLGTVYENQARYDTALKYFITAQAISESISDKRLMAYGKLSIANVYFRMQNYSGAMDYYREAGEIYRISGNNYGLLKAYTSLGQTASELDSIKLAIRYFNLAMRVSTMISSPNDEANIAIMLADLFEDAGIIDSARVNYEKANNIYRQTDLKENVSLTLIALARLKNYKKDYKGALKQLEEALEIAGEIKSPTALLSVYQELSISHSGLLDFRKAFDFLNMYSQLKDSVMTGEKQRQILELQTQYETEKKDKENEILKRDRKILQNTRNSLITGALLLTLIVLVIFRSLTIKKRDNRMLKEQRDEINRQKEIVETQKTSITDSIRYAKRIQSAMLPPDETLSQNLPDSFVLYLPRDIVSGDFYFVRELTENILLVCAADCTGHGVPGAFMSMLGMSLLNDIINSNQELIIKSEFKPSDILNELRSRVKGSLRQTGKDGEARDGMDLSLCLIDKASGTVNYSGANNPVYVVTNGNLTEYKAVRNPIGIYLNELSFRDNILSLVRGSMVYMFSDGFSDQIGSGGSKFLSKNLKKTLSGISHNNCSDIKQILTRKHLEWRGDEEQVDDILILGYRI